ncbi:MAG TPA: 5-dehydro-4-deoxy-D-glucuronate isomerase [Steroidobacteraceae bacterium]|nr:5-dehydro-4-deoxy-D-glucuronate isomerase [Steroidobacteraceae bacterium]
MTQSHPVLHATHPEMIKHLDSADLRRLYLIEDLFQSDKATLTLSHVERMMIGGALPVKSKVTLTESLSLARRELGIVNIGGPGTVAVDGKDYAMRQRDGLYVGMGTKDVICSSSDAGNPAKFYFVSTPAHAHFDTTSIPVEQAMPKRMGSKETCNDRTIYQYVNPAICKSSQLLMGLTILETGSIWNTMPCHTHERRSEVYFYFDMQPTDRVFHFMGQPSETRHIVIANEQAVVSPPWSIHMGAGTARYSFIWSMAGENQDYADMQAVPVDTLR